MKCGSESGKPCSGCGKPACPASVDGDCDSCLEVHASCIFMATGLTIKEYKKKYSKKKSDRFCLRCEDKKESFHDCKDTSVSYDDILIDVNRRANGEV